MDDGFIPPRNVAKYQIIKQFEVQILFPKMTLSDTQHIMEENMKKISSLFINKSLFVLNCFNSFY